MLFDAKEDCGRRNTNHGLARGEPTTSLSQRDYNTNDVPGGDPRLSLRGTPEGIRTPDQLLRRQLLYPLSYGRRLPFESTKRRHRIQPGEASGEGSIRPRK